MANSYSKNGYSKNEVHVVKITQIRLQKMKKNVVVPSFYFLKNKYFILLQKGEETPGLCCFLSTKK